MSGTNSSSRQQSVEGSPVDKQLKLSNPDDSLANEKGNYLKV